jgi:hypothetical protein
VGKTPIDPFAEQFSEEEIVLDSFASWDDIFHRETPRVKNRREPEFALLVQAAIETAPCLDAKHNPPALEIADDVAAFEVTSNPQNNATSPDPQVVAESQNPPSQDDPALDRSILRWPSLRLAVVSEPVLLQDNPLVSPGSSSRPIDENRPNHRRLDEAPCWATSPMVRHSPDSHLAKDHGIAAHCERDEESILVIDDDAACPTADQPPVRREEYRRLFSRLRSG